MGNPLRGEASLKAGDKTYTLVFDINAFCEIEAETSLGIDGLVSEIQSDPRVTLLRSIFCAGLQAKHPGTTLKEAGDIMSAAGLGEMKCALEAALKGALPEAKEKGANPPPRRPRRPAP